MFAHDDEALDENLKAAIAQALACASEDPSRAALAGAWLDVTSRDAHYVMGTDGRHLFSANSFHLGLGKPVFIPSHRFLEWNGFRSDGTWRLGLQATPSDLEGEWIRIASNRWTFAFRKKDVEIPKWRLVVPEDGCTMVVLGEKAMAFLSDVLPALPGHDQTSQPVRLDVTAGSLNVTGNDPRTGHSTTFPVDDVDIRGADLSITVNRDFVIKALKWGLNQLSLTDSCTPLVFSNAGRRLVAMPMRTEGPPAPPPATGSPDPEPAASNSNPQPSTQPEPETMPKNRIVSPAESEQPAHVPTEPVNRVAPVEDPTPSVPSKPTIRTVIEEIDALRDALRSTVRQFGEVVDSLRQVEKDRRSNDREIEAIREKLRALQGVRL